MERFFRFCIYMIILAALLVTSCEVSEPERIMNNKAYPPTVGSVVLNPMQPDMHVAGNIIVQMDVTKLSFSPSELQVEISNGKDYSYKYSTDKSPWTIRFGVDLLPEGKYDIGVYVFQNKKPHGLLSVAGVPSVLLTGSFIVDHTPAKPVIVSPIVYLNNGKAAQLEWTPSDLPNFRAYIIRRYTGNGQSEILSTIYDPTVTTFTDSKLKEIYGKRVSYAIEVTNDFSMETTTPAKVYPVHYFGSPIQLSGFSISYLGAFINPALPEIYYMTTDQLYSVSASNYNTLRTCRLPSPARLLNELRLTVSDDGKDLYILNKDKMTVDVLDSQTFTLKNTITFPTNLYSNPLPYINGEFIILGPLPGATIYVVDALSGTIKKTFTDKNVSSYQSILISADKSKLFCTASSSTYEHKIFIYDLNNNFQLINETTYSSDVAKTLIASDNTSLYEYDSFYNSSNGRFYGSFYVRNINSPGSVVKIDQSGKYNEVKAMCFTDSKIYICTSLMKTETEGGEIGGHIVELDKTSLKELRIWNTSDVFSDLSISNDGSRLYINGSSYPGLRCVLLVK